MIRIVLSTVDADRLKRPVEGQGGLQSLLRLLIRRIGIDGSLTLSSDEVARIRRYIARYGQGGFQDRLKPIIALIDSSAEPAIQRSIDEFR